MLFLFNSRLKKIMAAAPEGCLFLERKGILVKYDGFPHVNLPANSLDGLSQVKGLFRWMWMDVVS